MENFILNLETIDVAFRITSRHLLPAAHSYLLYAALTLQWPWLHEAEDIGVFPLRGDYEGGQIRIGPRSTLRVRTPAGRLPQVISLTGKRIQVGEAEVQVGV